MQVPSTQRVPSDELMRMLDDARQRTIDLISDLAGDHLLGPKIAIVNPPLWEVGHLGFFHDHFGLRTLHGLPRYQYPDAERLYDSTAIAHDDRWDLPLPSLDETLDYLRVVRDAMAARLPDGLAGEAESYVYQLTTFHEDMHGEAFTYTRQTLAHPPPTLSGSPPVTDTPTAGPLPGDVVVPGGAHLLGSDDGVPFRFDNEKGDHVVDVPAFRIARAPVTNAEFATFVDDGGYRRPEFWCEAGQRWLQQRDSEVPVYWRRGAAGWEVRKFDRWQPLSPHQPVIHVNWFEADAYCRWAGRRLPTEAEWDMTASRAPVDSGARLKPGKRHYPWGDTLFPRSAVNLDGYALGCVDVAAFPEGDSALGCRQMLGNVWEWTASVFAPFPGFQAELYREYSEPWFAERRYVLRGGAWATRSRMIHNGYRNFFTPERNDIFAGFRTCAL